MVEPRCFRHRQGPVCHRPDGTDFVRSFASTNQERAVTVQFRQLCFALSSQVWQP